MLRPFEFFSLLLEKSVLMVCRKIKILHFCTHRLFDDVALYFCSALLVI